jgi:hypothetical protein
MEESRIPNIFQSEGNQMNYKAFEELFQEVQADLDQRQRLKDVALRVSRRIQRISPLGPTRGESSSRTADAPFSSTSGPIDHFSMTLMPHCWP